MTPDFETFCQLAKSHDRVPVSRRLMGDGLTPVSAFQRIDDGQTACLFESVVGAEKVGRYSFLAVKPVAHMSAYGRNVQVSDHQGQHEVECDNPLDELRQRIGKLKVAQLQGQPPFTGGAIGYAAYDVVRYVESLPNAPEDDRQLPDLSFSFFEEMVVFDNVTKTVTVLALADCTDQSNLRSAYDRAADNLEILVEQLNQPHAHENCADIETGGPADFPYESNVTQQEFENSVARCVEYIKAGDIFQVVLSQRMKLEIEVEPFEIYRTLRVVNPSPFMFFLRTPETTLVGSSPEIMCRVVDRKVTVRPLAGTRPRGKTDEEDLALEEELLADRKNEPNMSCLLT